MKYKYDSNIVYMPNSLPKTPDDTNNTTNNNVDVTNAAKHNKVMQAKNGNRHNTIQLNTSNARFPHKIT